MHAAAVVLLWLAAAAPPQEAAPPAAAPAAPAASRSVTASELLGAVAYRLGQVQARELADAHPELDVTAQVRVERAAEAALTEIADEVAHTSEAGLPQMLTEEQRQQTNAFFDTPAGRAYTTVFLGGLAGLASPASVAAVRRRLAARVCADAKVCPTGR